MGFRIDCKKYVWIKPFTADELSAALSRAGGLVKLVCGGINGVSFLLMADARDILAKHPRYCGKVRQSFNAAFKEYDAYVRGLLYPASNMPRFFHVADMDEAARKRYGDITDKQYFEFWEGTAGTAYTQHRPFITSLANKYRLSLVRHDIRYAEILQWAMVTEAVLELADSMWVSAIDEMAKRYLIPLELLKKFFAPFRVCRVTVAWKRALYMLEPLISCIDLENDEERNIELGLIQMTEAFASPTNIYGTLSGAVDDYEEIFRTKGERRKLKCLLNDAADEVKDT